MGGGATLTVNIAHDVGAAAPSGTVVLREGNTPLATLTLSGGAASLPLSGLTAGAHTYTAVYGGDAIYLASTSNAVVVTADRASTTLVVSSTPTVLAGMAVRVSVTAAGSAGAVAAAPTGTVLLQEGSVSLGSISLTNGTGTLVLGGVPTGTHTLTASYAGDEKFAAASAAGAAIDVVDFSIAGPGTQTGITVTAGAVTGNTASLTLTPGSNGFPLSVAFICNGAPAGATCTVTPGSVVPGSAAVPVTVAVLTTARTSANDRLALAAWLGLPVFGLLVRGRKGAALRLTVLLLAAVAASLGVTGCGTGIAGSAAGATTATNPPSSSSPAGSGTPANTSTLTVQAVAASDGATLAHSASISLRVN